MAITPSPTAHAADHVDVLIVGAGLSGIGAARHLVANFPRKTFTILEAREAIGGTWDLFRYPGIRSDSDMTTLGYRSKPWTGDRTITDGTSIRNYIREAAQEAGVDRHVRYGHRVIAADWCSESARWTVTAQRAADGERVTLTCRLLFAASGYYRYDEGYTPEFEGIERFRGTVVHPQHWPEALDYTGKRVAVIGSGATAVTLVPAMTDRAAHVTMLQRSPTYVVSLPAADPFERAARRLLGVRRGYAITRWKNVLLQAGSYRFARRRPAAMKRILRRGLERRLPAETIDEHFTPRYDPWDQRLCVVPDADLFDAIRRGDASVVTDRIRTFTETGIELESGRRLEADVVVTATGLNLLLFGGVELRVDGERVHLPERIAYRGMMISEVPNFVYAIGYTNASWTLKVDLVCDYLARLLAHMDEHGYTTATPVNDDPSMQTQPLLSFASGYVQRAIEQFPKAGSRAPWQVRMSYIGDLIDTRRGRLDDGVMRFSAAPGRDAAERGADPSPLKLAA